MFFFCSMSETPTAAAPSRDPSQDPAALRLAMLHELAEIGMRLARGVERRAEAPDAAPGDLGLVFSRLARAVRQTLALEARLEGEIAARVREARAIDEVRLIRATRAAVERRAKLVRRAVGQAIEAEACENDFESLFDHLDERLADREDDEDFLDRPLGELVARICKDLGVTADLSLWEDEDWAIEAAAARPPPPAGEAPDPDPAYAAPPSPHRRPDGAPNWLSG